MCKFLTCLLSKKLTCSATTTKSNVVNPVCVMFHREHVWILNKPQTLHQYIHTLQFNSSFQVNQDQLTALSNFFLELF